MIKRLQFGALALSVYKSARTVAQQVDAGMVLAVVGKVLALEAEHSGPGMGAVKLRKLVGWVATQYPQFADRIGLIQSLVGAVVALLNAVQLFRAGATMGAPEQGA